jgi:hypothetical protein
VQRTLTYKILYARAAPVKMDSALRWERDLKRACFMRRLQAGTYRSTGMSRVCSLVFATS